MDRDEFLLDGTLWERIERIAQDKSIQCMKPFPHQQCCGCLSDKLPMVLTIAQYAFIVTSSHEAPRYYQVSDDERQMTDIARDVREECVAQTVGPSTR